MARRSIVLTLCIVLGMGLVDHRTAKADQPTGVAAEAGATAATAKADFFVSPEGNDFWSGRLPAANADKSDGPFATLCRARDAVRALKKTTGLKRPITVMLRGGRYFLEDPVVFNTKDSGSRSGPITYTAYPGERPVLSGGRLVTGWKPYKGEILQCDLPAVAGGPMRLRQLFYNGQRQIRARVPNFDPQNPIKGGWAVMEGAAAPGSQIALKYKPGTFARRWAKPSQGEVNTFVGGNWGNNIVPIRSVDRQNRVITLTRTTRRFMKPMLPFDYPSPFNSHNRFIVENLLEELDQPGEWCWDTEAGKLYFWPPDGKIESSQVIVPQLDRLVSLQNVSHVNISGLNWAHTTSGDNTHHHGVEGTGAMYPVRGWKQCGEALLLEDCSRCLVEGNTFRDPGSNAVYLKGLCVRNTIRGNEITGAGANGICLAGRVKRDGKKSRLERLVWASKIRIPGGIKHYPLFNLIVDNHIERCGAINNYTAGIFAALSEGNVIGHNAIHYVPHHAINLGNTGRSHNIVEYNDISHTCLATGDTAAINCWMEEDPRDGQRNGHIIRYNRIADSFGKGLYLDNYSSNCFVFGNVFLRNKTCGIFINGGKNNTLENNIAVDCAAPVAYTYSCDCYGAESIMPHMFEFISGNRFCYNIVVGHEGKALYPYGRSRKYSVSQSDYNVYYETAGAESYLKEARKKGLEEHSLLTNPMFVDLEKEDFRLKPQSPALKLGFQPIDFSKIGPRNGSEK